MINYVDLHTHTNRSDGELDPAALVRLAKETGLAAVAVTDHDTTAGLDEALAEGERIGIEVVPGLELSTLLDGHVIHLVCLYPDYRSESLNRALEETISYRNTRNEKILQNLKDLGLPLTEEEVPGAKDGTVTRANIAQAMLNRGYVKSVRQAFDLYLAKGKPAYAEKKTMTPQEGIELMHREGALVFLAHFHQIVKGNLAESERYARTCFEAGADGIETKYCSFGCEEEKIAEELALEYNLLRSGGSDFHGCIKPGLMLGRGYGSLRVPAEYLDEIRKRAAVKTAGEVHLLAGSR